MRNLVVWNLMTLDGYFDGAKPWDLKWHGTIYNEEMEKLSIDQLHSIDTLLFGRKTYEGMFEYWSHEEPGEVADLMNSTKKVVVSKTLQKAEWSNSELIRSNVIEEVKKLKQRPGKDIAIFGSGDLMHTLLEAGLIDEVRIGLAPTILGGGSPLFKPSSKGITMKLIDVRTLSSGGVIIRYRPIGA